MTVTSYEQWVRDGKPWRPAPVIAAFAALMRSHGFTVYEIGDQQHLTAAVPEDHTPFSHTPWPGPQPYPQVLALDVMPFAGAPVDWRALGALIVSDRDAGVPGTEWIKYVNWTSPAGHCWHSSWEPAPSTSSSTDTGHIHISARTDQVDAQLHGWDPVARLLAAAGGATLPPQGDPMLTNWTTVKRDSTDPWAVRTAQGLLLAHGYPVGSRDGLPDGSFGPVTEASTRSLQTHYGIQVDGEFGPHTLSVALYKRDLA